MRLLIYILALVTGLSAGEASRAEIRPASSVAQTAVAAAEALASQDQTISDHPQNSLPDDNALAFRVESVAIDTANTPITRHDLTRE
jgi:hypothetical protein